ncbi:MAG TPA: Uma2 family endonuclease [Blastocatellia bacterium]|nr:Uma2 family endonuclease [Blastocatellia bacterium]
MGLAQRKLLSPEEYLALERASEIRHEYADGQIHAMAGESLNHSRICVNLAREISNQLKGRPCEAFSPNMKVRNGAASQFAYPDLTIVCGQPVFHDEFQDVLVNAKVIFEVLSTSTEAYDRGRKFLRYQSIETFTDYVLIAQEEPWIEHRIRRPEGEWTILSVTGLENSLYIASISCTLRLAEVYDRVVFPVPDGDA